MAKLFIDITELAYWQGKLTGVPRVMNELAMRFAEDQATVFVVWDGAARNYQKIEFKPSSIVSTVAASVEPDSLPSEKYARIIRLGQRVKRRSRLAAKALSVPERAARKVLKPKPFADVTTVVVPEKTDTIFVLADWHGSDSAFINYLKEAKERGVVVAQISYDMLPLVTPQYSGHATETFGTYAEKIYPICDLIFAISKSTKHDIEAWLSSKGLRVPPIQTMRLGDDFKISKPVKPSGEDFAAGGLKGQDYILCVGTIEARKNHTLLYYTYKLATQKDRDLPKLVIVGRRGWKTDDIFDLITTDPDTKSKMIFLQHTSDEELSWLYQNCLFSIYPSFYEGWGLPIAESLAYGVPCISSNTSSMPEIAGDLITYFSPSSSEGCLQAITDLLQPGAIDKAKQTIKAYNPISWDDTFTSVKHKLKEMHGR